MRLRLRCARRERDPTLQRQPSSQKAGSGSSQLRHIHRADVQYSLSTLSRLTMSCASNRKWSRFGQKGGIGRAKGKVDKLAEPDSDELMFMEDEEVVVLALLRESSRRVTRGGARSPQSRWRWSLPTTPLMRDRLPYLPDDGVYLGCCEGVVGIFHESEVTFTTKLKKPVFTKKPPAAASLSASEGRRRSRSGSANTKMTPTVATFDDDGDRLARAAPDGNRRMGSSPRASLVQHIAAGPGRRSSSFSSQNRRSSREQVALASGRRRSAEQKTQPTSRRNSKHAADLSTTDLLDAHSQDPLPMTEDAPTTPLDQSGPSTFQSPPWSAGTVTATPKAAHSPQQLVSSPTGLEHTSQDQTRRKRQGIASPVEIGFPESVQRVRGDGDADATMAAQAAFMRGMEGRQPTSPTAYREGSSSSVDPESGEDRPPDTPATEAENFIFDSYRYSAVPSAIPLHSEGAHARQKSQQSAVSSAGSIDAALPTWSTPAPALAASYAELGLGASSRVEPALDAAGGSVASLLRRRMEQSTNGATLQAPLPITTTGTAESRKVDGLSAPSPRLPSTPATADPRASTMPILPKGMSLKQLRASPGSTGYAFPRRASPGNALGETANGTGNRYTSVPRRVASGPASPAHRPHAVEQGPHSPHLQLETNFRTSPAYTSGNLASSRMPSFGSSSPRSPQSPMTAVQYGLASPSMPLQSPASDGFYSSSSLDRSQSGHQKEYFGSRSQPSPDVPPSPAFSPSSETPSLLSKEGGTKMRHSRSLSGLSRSTSRSGSLLSRRRPSLPNNNTLETNVQIVGNTEFEFVKLPSSTRLAASASKEDDLAASSSSVLPPRSSDAGEGTPTLDYETDNEGGLGASLLVTRPTAAAKERVRSIYIQDQYIEPAVQTDTFGFIHKHDPRAIKDELEMNAPQDLKALEAHRARELKWVQSMNAMTPSAAKKSKKMRKLVSYGIPNSVRGSAWAFLAETDSIRQEGLYHDLCGRHELECYAEIEKDLDRTLCARFILSSGTELIDPLLASQSRPRALQGRELLGPCGLVHSSQSICALHAGDRLLSRPMLYYWRAPAAYRGRIVGFERLIRMPALQR